MLEVYCGAMLLDEARCRRAIGEAFPSVEVESARYFAAGWDYEIWEVNESLLFRFPMREACAGPLLVEARLLPELAAHISAGVPRPEYVTERCPSFRWPFLGYRKLPGLPLSEAALQDEAKVPIAEQAGRFLRELHRFPVERAAGLGVPSYDGKSWHQWYVNFHEQIRAMVGPSLEPDTMAAVESFWRALLQDEEFFRFQPVLIHRDFDDAHILIQDGRLTGVIDFADACVGDPALDFAGCEGAFRAGMLAAYGCSREEAQRLSVRANVYRRISPFHAIVFGIEIDDGDWVRRGVEAIREAFGTGGSR